METPHLSQPRVTGAELHGVQNAGQPLRYQDDGYPHHDLIEAPPHAHEGH